MELLCVDVDSSSAPPRIGKFQKIPLLCLYTKKDVFVLELGYKPSGASEVEGQVLSVTEPFEEVLMGTSTTTSIIRIRQAPQRHTGYATMCPPKSMAMLAYDSMTQEYSINLFHANEALVSRHFHGMEHLEEQTETITDFCFCQSNAFSLLSSMSVALLKGSGEVLFASPILFRGTVVPRSIVSKTLEYLQLEPAEEGSARRRQFLSAKRYLMDTFPDDGRSHFLTAQVRSLAFEWPVRVQGPVFRNFQCTESLASAIEPVVAGDLVGLCIGHLGDIVEFGLLSPTTLVPRFKLEDDADTNELDQAFRRGNIVQRVDLRDDEYNQERNNASMALICDPIIDSVVHYVTPSSIRSISTNTVKIAAAKVREQAGSTGGMFSPASKRKDMRPRTTAWSCLDINSFQDTRNSVVGAVVSDDVHLGHVLVSRLSNQSMVAINLTESRQLQEMDTIGDGDELAKQANGATTLDRELRALQDTAPLAEIVEPLLKKVIAGLGGMGKVVGSSTPAAAITPDLLAAATSVKERCDKEILLPLLELNEYVKARRKELKVMHENQMAQVKSLKDLMAKLKQRNSTINEKAEIVATNAKVMAQRSGSVLQASSDLLPTITQTEFDYFQELKRLHEKTNEWQQEFEHLNRKVSIIGESVDNGILAGPMVLPRDLINNSTFLLRGCEKNIRDEKTKLREAKDQVDMLAAVAGVDLDPNGPVGTLQ